MSGFCALFFIESEFHFHVCRSGAVYLRLRHPGLGKPTYLQHSAAGACNAAWDSFIPGPFL
jgi:hypothetical protein